MNGWTTGVVAVTGGHLAYHRTGGDGPVLVLSHGLTDNGLCWSRFASALGSAFDIVMLDARGHGESSRIGVQRAQSPGEDIAQAVDAAIKETGASSMKDMGNLMKAVMAKLAGQTVDGKQVSDLVKSKLGK